MHFWLHTYIFRHSKSICLIFSKGCVFPKWIKFSAKESFFLGWAKDVLITSGREVEWCQQDNGLGGPNTCPPTKTMNNQLTTNENSSRTAVEYSEATGAIQWNIKTENSFIGKYTKHFTWITPSPSPLQLDTKKDTIGMTSPRGERQAARLFQLLPLPLRSLVALPTAVDTCSFHPLRTSTMSKLTSADGAAWNPPHWVSLEYPPLCLLYPTAQE